jgi:lipopolysaccharide heptosyltransferase II
MVMFRKRPDGAANAVGRILVLRLSSIGDILLTTPILRLLRQHYPGARIDFLVKADYEDLLRVHPCIDRLLLYHKHQTLWRTLQTLRQTRYDIVLDLHRTLRSRLLYHGLAAARKLAYEKRPLRRALLVWLGWNTLRAMTPVPELYAAPLRRLGIEAPVGGLDMALSPESREAVREYLEQAFPDGGRRPLLAVAPGARWATKRWPVERFIAVAQAVAESRGAAVVVLGSQEDRPLARELCTRLEVPVLDSTGRLSLMQTAALLERCRLLLSNDSGLMHMATALQIPVVAIFGPTVQEFGFYPFRARAQVVSADLACRPCSTKGSAGCPRGHHHCMQHVTSSRVLSVAQHLWNSKGAPHDHSAL